jgi:hypothetical protein
MDVHPNGHPDGQPRETGAKADGAGWRPLDFLRSLGRAATIASGATLDSSAKQHADYRGFRIFTSGQDGSYGARVTHWQGEAIRRAPNHTIDNARFGSHEEAAQHARFVIASGALNHLGPGAATRA